jgi:hypothetical protein
MEGNEKRTCDELLDSVMGIDHVLAMLCLASKLEIEAQEDGKGKEKEKEKEQASISYLIYVCISRPYTSKQ